MKLTLFLVFFFWSSANAFTQKVTLSVKSATLNEVLRQIKDQSGVRILYDAGKTKQIQCQGVKIVDMHIAAALEEVLKDTRFEFFEEGGVYIVREMAAQQAKALRIVGKVVDEKKQPLPGVTVQLKGLSIGTATTGTGDYALTIPNAPKKFTLVYSFVGMISQEIAYAGKDTINVVMKEDVATLEDVVVTGYQVLKKRSMAGSSSSVKAEELVLNGTQTLEQALQGKLPGMMVINQSGLTGTRQKVRVRGTSTLVGNPEPVWVVDGIIQEDPLPFNTTDLANIVGTDMDMIRDFVGGAIAWLNPNDIDNIVVLKDASATAIYGVKAANGVIVITTKKGQKGRMSLGYSGSFSTSSPLTYKDMELMNSKQRVDVSREGYEKGAIVQREDRVGYMALLLAYKRREISYEEFNTAAKKLETNNTDWFDLLFQVPFSHSHSISISGGDDKATYRASFGMNNQNNTAKGNSQDSYNGSLHVSSTFWDQVIVSFGLSGNTAKTKAFAGIDPYNYASTTNRSIPCYDESGNLSFYNNGIGQYNILHELANSGNRNTTSSINSNLNVRWTLGCGLTLSSILGYNFSTSHGESWYTEQSNHIRGIRGYEFGTRKPGDQQFIDSPLPFGGVLNMSESRNSNYTWRNQLEFSKTFDRHVMMLMFGEELRSNKYDGYEQTSYGYMLDRGKSFAKMPLVTGKFYSDLNKYANSTPKLTDRELNYLSFYGNMSYMFDDRYALNASIRMDASNRFGQDKSTRYQPVWSVGGRWNVTREHWLEGQNILNDVSLRASYGFQGNVAENVGPDLIAKLDVIDEKNGEYRLSISRLPAPHLKWEKNKNINLGIDFSILGSRVNGTFEYFHKYTEDLITTREVPYENGVTTMLINGGNMQNSGWELSFSLVPVRTKDFVWSLGMNTSKVYNELASDLAPTGKWEDVVAGNFHKKGYAVSSFWAFRFKGLNPEYGGPEFDFLQANAEAASLDVTQYMKYAGKLEPDFTAGLNTSFRYKGLSLSANFYLSTGNQKFLAAPYGGKTKMVSEYQNLSTQLLDRWRKPGDEKYTTIPSLPTPKNSDAIPFAENSEIFPYDAWSYSDIRVVDAWYLRCNNISVSYMMPQELINGFAQNVSFSFVVSNPFQIVSKDFQGRDPEVAMGQQPLSRNYSLSVNVSF